MLAACQETGRTTVEELDVEVLLCLVQSSTAGLLPASLDQIDGALGEVSTFLRSEFTEGNAAGSSRRSSATATLARRASPAGNETPTPAEEGAPSWGDIGAGTRTTLAGSAGMGAGAVDVRAVERGVVAGPSVVSPGPAPSPALRFSPIASTKATLSFTTDGEGSSDGGTPEVEGADAAAAAAGAAPAAEAAATAGAGPAPAAAEAAATTWGVIPAGKEAAVEAALNDIGRWDFDVFAVEALVPRAVLTTVAMRLMDRSGLLASCGLDRATTLNWVTAIESQYRQPQYHTSTHAADVTQSMFVMLRTGDEAHSLGADAPPTLTVNGVPGPTREQLGRGGGMRRWLSDLRSLTCLLAALAHDVNHPGANNPFLVATSHPLAIQYNDKSPLENMHAATAFATMRRAGCDVLAALEPADRKQVRADMVTLILNTDNGLHFANLGAFKQRLEVATRKRSLRQRTNSAGNVKAGAPLTAAAEPAAAAAAYVGAEDLLDLEQDLAAQQTVMELTLHAADISNVCKTWVTYREWVDRLLDEFYALGDRERELGMPVTQMLDRTKPAPLHAFQLGFINAIVKPLYDELERLRGVDMTAPLTTLNANIQRWQAKAASLEAEKKAEAEPEEGEEEDDGAGGDQDEGAAEPAAAEGGAE